jgi:hypothetical protein
MGSVSGICDAEWPSPAVSSSPVALAAIVFGSESDVRPATLGRRLPRTLYRILAPTRLRILGGHERCDCLAAKPRSLAPKVLGSRRSPTRSRNSA